MTIAELYKNEQEYWQQQNIKLFGLELVDELDTYANIQKSLNKSCKKYWNNDDDTALCKLAYHMNYCNMDVCVQHRKEKSYKLTLNPISMCVDVSAAYNVYDKKSKQYNVLEFKLAALPLPLKSLSWKVYNANYTPRITAVRDDFNFIKRIDNIIRGHGWSYNIDTDKFECVLKNKVFDVSSIDNILENHTSIRTRALLSAVLGCTVDSSNFTTALRKVPIIKNNSIFNYKYARLEMLDTLIFSGIYKANPIKNTLIGINQMIVSKSRPYIENMPIYESDIVMTTSPIFALENFRTVVNIFKNNFKPAFQYTDSVGFFDSFKTVTSETAGRQRMLLDNIIVKDDMLWVRHTDEHNNIIETNMFEYFYNPQDARLSSLSYSPFCNNDKPKRIMMNAKLTAQAVTLPNEQDSLTHRVLARVGFGDVEGYNYADSIIISESFAKKLTTNKTEVFNINIDSSLFNTLETMHENKRYLFTLPLLKKLFPTRSDAILDNYTNISITHIEYIYDQNTARVWLYYEIPFRIGDKLTNLHGAKGTVGMIIPDKDMPRLINNLTPKMSAGSLDIILSGFSTMRRGTLGQLFEAWANANDIKLDGFEFISNYIEQYGDSMIEYANKSIVQYKDNAITMPVGIINIMRLHHDATNHLIEASIVDNTNCESTTTSNKKVKAVRLGEMEKFNLVASNCTNILKELSYRGVHRYTNMHNLIKSIETNRMLPNDASRIYNFATIFKALGYELVLDGTSLSLSDYSNCIDEDDLNILNAQIL